MCSPQHSVWGRSVGGFGLCLELCSQTAEAGHSRLGRGDGPFATVPPVTSAPQSDVNPREAEGREKLGPLLAGTTLDAHLLIAHVIPFHCPQWDQVF